MKRMVLAFAIAIINLYIHSAENIIEIEHARICSKKDTIHNRTYYSATQTNPKEQLELYITVDSSTGEIIDAFRQRRKILDKGRLLEPFDVVDIQNDFWVNEYLQKMKIKLKPESPQAITKVAIKPAITNSASEEALAIAKIKAALSKQSTAEKVVTLDPMIDFVFDE